MPREKTIVQNIIDRLNRIPGCRAVKSHGSSYGMGGQPDIHGCIDGRRFDIEVKQPGKKPTSRQMHELGKWLAAGSLSFWTDDADMAVDYVKQMRPGKVDKREETTVG